MRLHRLLPLLIVIGVCVLIWLGLLYQPARAQTVNAEVVSLCGAPNHVMVVGNTYPITQDNTGKGCSSSSTTVNIPAVGANGGSTPTSSILVGSNVGGLLQPASSSNPLPVSGAVTLNGSTNNIGNVGVNQGSATAGQVGPLVQCAVTTAAPSYTTGQTSPVSCDTSGNLRTSGGGGGGGGAVFGPTAAGSAPVNPPVLVSGIDGTNIRTLLTDTAGRLTVIGAYNIGSAAPTNSIAPAIVASDGTNSRLLSVDTSGRLVLGAGANVIGVVGVSQASTTSGQSGTLDQCAVTTASPTYTTAQTDPLSCDTSGNLRVNVVAGGTSGTVAQGSTTSGQSGMLIQGAVTTAAPSYTTAQTNPLSLDTVGRLRVDGGGVAQGSTTSGQIGQLAQCAVTSVPPSYTTAQTNPLSCDTSGEVRVVLNTANLNTPADSQAQGVSLPVQASLSLFNGTNTNRARDITGAVAAGTGDAAVVVAPTTSANAGLTAVPSTAVETGHVIKASAGNLYGFQVTSGASAGFVMVFNSTTVPADGAVTPVKCYVIAANSTLASQWDPAPLQLNTGVTIVFSTTGCFTKTASATAFISGDAK